MGNREEAEESRSLRARSAPGRRRRRPAADGMFNFHVHGSTLVNAPACVKPARFVAPVPGEA